MELTMIERAARLARNPHNFHDSRYGGGMSAHEAAKAQFEREGRNARLGADDPYKPGTMASDAWQAGQRFKHGMHQFGQGWPCPNDPATGEGWSHAQADYQRQLADYPGEWAI